MEDVLARIASGLLSLCVVFSTLRGLCYHQAAMLSAALTSDLLLRRKVAQDEGGMHFMPTPYRILLTGYEIEDSPCAILASNCVCL